MSDREDRIKSTLVTYFPMFIATLSLVTSIYNGYLNGKFVDLIQRNVGRVEYMRTCKEVIDAYFQVKFRAGLINAAAQRPGEAAAVASSEIEGANAVAKFSALGTWLANLRDEATRRRYTELSSRLVGIVGAARLTPPDAFKTLFDPADQAFAELNNDCVKSANAQPM